MRSYKELSTLYDRKFLNYIISRSKALSASRVNLEYEDLVQDGLFKLVTLYANEKKPDDPIVMKSLVNMYNTIYTTQKNVPIIMSIDELEM